MTSLKSEDQYLAGSKHVKEKSKKIPLAIGALKCVRPFITIDVANEIYKAIIQPHIDYFSNHFLWPVHLNHLLLKISSQLLNLMVLTNESKSISLTRSMTKVNWEAVKIIRAPLLRVLTSNV